MKAGTTRSVTVESTPSAPSETRSAGSSAALAWPSVPGAESTSRTRPRPSTTRAATKWPDSTPCARPEPWAQVDNEFWFVAPEVTSSHGDSPVLLRFATFDAPADVVVDMPGNANYATYNLTIPANSALSIDLTDSLSWYENQPFDEVLDKGTCVDCNRLWYVPC